MKVRVTGLRIVLAIVVIVAGSIFATGMVITVVEMPATTYRTLDQAKADGAISRGWLPPFLAASTTDIREVHDIDTNAQWFSFHAPAADLRQMVQGFRPLSFAEARRTALPRPWRVGGKWPPELSSPWS